MNITKIEDGSGNYRKTAFGGISDRYVFVKMYTRDLSCIASVAFSEHAPFLSPRRGWAIEKLHHFKLTIN